ncbi:MAG: serine protease [Bacteroidales bacterium]|nr:serine protease [Bacteroidales bacterium]
MNSKHIIKSWTFFMVIGGLLLSCSAPRNQDASPDYFAYKKTIRKEFSAINKNIFQVYSATDYKTFTFPSDSQIRKKELGVLDKSKYSTHTNTQSTRGTAILIHGDDKQHLFLTSYHVFNYPDTVIDYYYRDDGIRTPFIAQLSIKTRQRQIIKKHGESMAVENVAHNKKNDIAFLTGKPETSVANRIQKTHVNIASEKDLRTGTEVFVTGFPSGYFMVTRGLISQLLTNKMDKVLIDAPFNKGYSGSPFFVLSPGCECFSLAGIITSAAVEKKNILVPEFQRYEKSYDPKSIYTDPSYVNEDKRIKYGVTFGTGIKTIKKFYTNHSEEFKENGISLDYLFDVKEP